MPFMAVVWQNNVISNLQIMPLAETSAVNVRGRGTKLGEGAQNRLGGHIISYVRGKGRLGQDSLPNIAETSGKVGETSRK